MPHLLFPIVFASGLALSAALPCQSDAELAEQQKLEAAFAQQMSGCRMVGKFTLDGSNKPAQAETYTLGKVEKVRDEKWRIEAKIEYQDKSATVPLTVDVFWADDTPTIQVTKLSVPGLGTYSARVVIYGDRYAGIWSGKSYGGHMFGKVESAQSDAAIAKGKAQGSDAKWPTWRGPDGSGEAKNGNPPVTWSETDNVAWKTALPGLGNSTPVIWGNHIYVTTAIETEEVGEAPELPAAPERAGGGARAGERGGRRGGRRSGRRGGGQNHPAPKHVFDFRVICLERQSGKVEWSTSVVRAVPHEGGHKTGSQASSSPITDGTHLFAHFGSRGVHCLTLDGKLVWSRNDLGLMRTRNQFGEGSSPALSGNTLIVNWDHEGDSFVVALDKATGKEKWRQARDEVTSWSTPVIAEVDGRAQAIITATGASRAYDVETGHVVWSCTGMTVNAIPTPIVQDGTAYLMSGFRGAMLQAIRLSGAKGDITDSDHVLWSHNRQTSYVPSALLYGANLYFLRSNNAVLTCLDAATGKLRYEGQRLPGLRTVYSSPLGAAGRVYLVSRDGVTKVFKAGDTYEELATNELDDAFDASPVVIGDQMYLRGHDSLYCLANK